MNKLVPNKRSLQKSQYVSYGMKGWEGCAICSQAEGQLGSYPVLLALGLCAKARTREARARGMCCVEARNGGCMTLLEQFQKDIVGLEDSGAGLPFVFSPTQAFTLLGMLQLVLRHPKIKPGSGPASEFAQGLADVAGSEPMTELPDYMTHFHAATEIESE